MTGATATPPGLHGELERELGGIGALACYGLTEAPFLSVSSVGDPGVKRAETVGRAVAGAHVAHRHARRDRRAAGSRR